jgi:hypothetical protein
MGVSGINSWLFNNQVNFFNQIENTSAHTERFKGTVTGYTPPQRNPAQSAANARQTQEYVSALKDFGGQLRSATSQLSSRTGESVFNTLTGTSSANNTLSVSVTNQAEAARFAESRDTKDISVQQLASAQRNTGESLRAASVSGIQQGSNRFEIEKGGETFQFSVNVNLTDSNRTVQQKMADAINRESRLGVTASVQFDERTQQSALIINGNASGEQQAFNISDVEGRGELVSRLGADNTTRAAANAQFTVDGTVRSSATNTADIGDGMRANLLRVSDNEVQVGVSRDNQRVSGAIREMVELFNNIAETTQRFNGDPGAQALRQRLNSAASMFSGQLNNAGISTGKDGMLQIDEQRLNRAVETGAAERALGGESGFTRRVSQLAQNLDNNPHQFVSNSARAQTGASSSPNFNNIPADRNNSFANYLMMQRHSNLINNAQLFDTGLFFSSIF